ncbi:hypothetical protein [Photorhabdus luminescens]|uniref:Uncharacterized protein n=1 Tax=Photorhabdus luminescens subsp. mexicana TaxID=2100167 RepID=A0A4R4IR46_PHOLU|nr:hypothetical protein [Photorhabdus luminescens]TDB42649.1 hypothetical protein C5468_24510 [Photorhabdus luminescens subsp. mexicana]
MNDLEYWSDCIYCGADDCDLVLTQEQVKSLAESVMRGHEYYGMSFYSPPSNERYAEIEREWKLKLDKLQNEFDAYINNAETAVRIALRQHRDTKISISKDGTVFRCDGRSEQVQ